MDKAAARLIDRGLDRLGGGTGSSVRSSAGRPAGDPRALRRAACGGVRRAAAALARAGRPPEVRVA